MSRRYPKTPSEALYLAAQFVDKTEIRHSCGGCYALDVVTTDAVVRPRSHRPGIIGERDPFHETFVKLDKIRKSAREYYRIFYQNTPDGFWYEMKGTTPEEAKQHRILSLLLSAEIALAAGD